jgi:uncharacterized protein with HEPN domain
MSRDDRLFLHHMRDHARKALALSRGKTRAEFDADESLRLALCYLLQIIGEATSRVTRSTKAAHPEIPWTNVVGMRHRLVHGYFQIDDDVVWKTVTGELRPLLAAIERLLEH